MRLLAPSIAFQLTLMDEDREVGKPLVAFQKHARKLQVRQPSERR